MKLLLAFLMVFVVSSVQAENSGSVQLDTQGLNPVKVTDNIWAIVGPLSNRTPENLGNTATFGVVITSEGLIFVGFALMIPFKKDFPPRPADLETEEPPSPGSSVSISIEED